MKLPVSGLMLVAVLSVVFAAFKFASSESERLVGALAPHAVAGSEDHTALPQPLERSGRVDYKAEAAGPATRPTREWDAPMEPLASESLDTLQGRVVDDDGHPLDVVSICLASSPASHKTVSGPDGFFELDVPDGGGPLMLRARKPGYASLEIPVAGRSAHVGRASLSISMLRGSSIRGTAYSHAAATGLMRVWVEREENPLHGLRGPRRSRDLDPSPEGFHFASLASGTYRVCAFAPGLALCVSEPISLKDSAGVVGITLQPVPESILHGSVRRVDGTPVSRGTIGIVRTGRQPESGDLFVRDSVRLDEEGSFRLRGLTSGDYLLSVECSSGISSRFIIAGMAVGESRYEQITMRQGAVLEGTVRDERGLVAAGRRVVIRHRTSGSMCQVAVSDEDGSYRFSSLDPGAYTVQATEQVFLDEGATVSFNLTVKSATRLRGLVQSSTGVVSGARVRFQPAAAFSGSEAVAVTDDSGFFEFPRIVPGEYSMRVIQRGTLYALGIQVVPETESYRVFSIGAGTEREQ